MKESCTLKQGFIQPGVKESHWIWSPWVLVI